MGIYPTSPQRVISLLRLSFRVFAHHRAGIAGDGSLLRMDLELARLASPLKPALAIAIRVAVLNLCERVQLPANGVHRGLDDGSHPWNSQSLIQELIEIRPNGSQQLR